MNYIDSKRGLSIVLLGAQTGVVNLHKEISSSDVVFGKPLYESILCSVCEGVYEGVKVACKRFNPKGLGFSWESFRQEVSLLAYAHSLFVRTHLTLLALCSIQTYAAFMARAHARSRRRSSSCSSSHVVQSRTWCAWTEKSLT